LVASSRLAARCSAVIPCDSALPPSLFFGLGLRDTADKASDRQACRDAHPLVSLQPILVWAQKIANLARARSLVMATVPGGGMSMRGNGRAVSWQCGLMSRIKPY